MKQHGWREQFEIALARHMGREASPVRGFDMPVERCLEEPGSDQAGVDAALVRFVGKATWEIRFRGYAGTLEHALSLIKSPIEKAMLSALLVAGYESAEHVRLRYVDETGTARELGDDGSRLPFLLIETQKRIGPFQVDLLLSYLDRDPGASGDFLEASAFRHVEKLVIECDGHDFHDKTRGQASSDRRRDRSLQRLGCKVFRYTGSDIWQDVFECAREALQAVSFRSSFRQMPRRNKQPGPNGELMAVVRGDGPDLSVAVNV